LSKVFIVFNLFAADSENVPVGHGVGLFTFEVSACPKFSKTVPETLFSMSTEIFR